jgi:VWFA-related protein
LSITARPAAQTTAIRLNVFVPVATRVFVKGGNAPVILRGQMASLAIETEGGNITVHLPEKTNTDVSLHTIQGTLESQIPVALFGQTDAHYLDGRIGKGGSPAIIRSRGGQIRILPDAATRWEALSHIQVQPSANDRAAGPESSKTTTADEPGNAVKVAIDTDASLPHLSEPAVKLETRLVNLNVKVTDKLGNPLPALGKTDFQILEDTVPQEITYFEPVTAPLNIVLLLDLSGSTEKKMKIIKHAAKSFVESLNPTDRIAIAGFTRRFMLVSNFTTDRKLLKDRIDDIKNRHSGTAYYDAMWSALNLFDEASASRKAIVVITDGVDNSLEYPKDHDYDPKHSYQELIERIVEADVTIYPIYLDTEYETVVRRGMSDHDAYATARKQVAEVAEVTGSVMFRADRAEDLEGVYKQVAAELHSLYSLAYTPKEVRKDGKWRKIQISVNRDGAKARTRHGYFAK